MKINSKLNKKGQISQLPGGIISLAVAAIVLVLMLIILTEIRDTPIVTNVFSNSSVINESSTVRSGQNLTYNLIPIRLQGTPSCVATVSLVTNGSVATPLGQTGNILQGAAGSENWTVSGCTFKFLPGTGETALNNSFWNITYSYTYGDIAFSSGNKTLFGLASFADFWVIIVLALVAAIVITIIFTVFGRRVR